VRRKKVLAEVRLHEGETLEAALRRFKRKVLEEGIIQEVKRRAFYLDSSEEIMGGLRLG
jgi:small subunit ribosomal protein S21